MQNSIGARRAYIVSQTARDPGCWSARHMAYTFATRRRLAWWIVPLAVLVAVLHWETRTLTLVSARTASTPLAQSVVVSPAVLPEYGIEGGIAARAATVQRTLFNPTRRPAPAAVSEPAEAQSFRKGQFALVGSSVTNDRRVAFLREMASGKSRMVRQGDEINGITIAEVSPETVRLQRGSQSEELRLAGPGKART